MSGGGSRRSLDEERHIEPLLVVVDAGDGRFDGGPRLDGGQKEARLELAPIALGSVERKVLTPVPDAQTPGRDGCQVDALRVGPDASAHRIADTMADGRPAKGLQPLEGRFGQLPSALGPAIPKGLRLDLDDLDEVGDYIPDQIDTRDGDDSDAEIEPATSSSDQPSSPTLGSVTWSGTAVSPSTAACQIRNLPDVQVGHPPKPGRTRVGVTSDATVVAVASEWGGRG